MHPGAAGGIGRRGARGGSGASATTLQVRAAPPRKPALPLAFAPPCSPRRLSARRCPRPSLTQHPLSDIVPPKCPPPHPPQLCCSGTSLAPPSRPTRVPSPPLLPLCGPLPLPLPLPLFPPPLLPVPSVHSPNHRSPLCSLTPSPLPLCGFLSLAPQCSATATPPPPPFRS